MADDKDPSMFFGKLTADERRIWEQIKTERAAGAEAERLVGLEKQAAGIADNRQNIARQEYEASGRERAGPGRQSQGDYPRARPAPISQGRAPPHPKWEPFGLPIPSLPADRSGQQEYDPRIPGWFFDKTEKRR